MVYENFSPYNWVGQPGTLVFIAHLIGFLRGGGDSLNLP